MPPPSTRRDTGQKDVELGMVPGEEYPGEQGSEVLTLQDAEKGVSQTATLGDPSPLFSSNVRKLCLSQEGTIQKDER